MSANPWPDEFKSAHGLARALGARGSQLLVLALLVALALDCGLILTRALGGDGTVTAGTAAPATFRPTVNPTLQLATIVNAHLFGLAGSSGSGDAPPTTMPLVLAGVIADRDPQRGQAIIGENAAAAKLYAVGAAIPGGAHLKSVYSDRVLIERNGGVESLMLPHTPLPGPGPGGADTALLATPAVRDNATLLAGLVRVQPVFNQGKLGGYRIFPGAGRGASAFNELGLRPGDMILAVNGTTLDDPARAMEVLQTLSSAGTATVTVARNGENQDIALNLAALSAVEQGDAPAGAASAPPPPPAPGGRLRFGLAPTGDASGAAAPASAGER